MFISAVDTTIVNVALPEISDELDAGIGELQWVLDGFLVCLACLLLVGSGLADRFGRRRVFLSGFAAFAIASVLAALAQTAGQLIAARVLMGAAAACILPPALSLLAIMFTPAERTSALAIWSAVAGIGIGLGPVVGGLLVPLAGWQAVFLVNVPFAVVAVPAGLALLPESRREDAPPIDLLAAALSMAALGGIVFALIESASAGWTSAGVIVPGLAGLAAAVGFTSLELRRRHPLFDVRVLIRPAVVAGTAAILAIYIAFLALLFLLPQYLQYVQNRSILASGLLLAPIGIVNALTSPFNPRIQRALGPRRAIVVGLVCMAAGAALLLFLDNTTPLWLVLVSTGVLGGFLVIAIVPATAVIMNDLGEERAGDGGAVNQLARQVGGALGVAIVGTVFAAVYAARIDDELQRFPRAARERAGESIEEAEQVISQAGRSTRDALLARADESFDVAARAGFGVSVAVLLCAALVVAVALRR